MSSSPLTHNRPARNTASVYPLAALAGETPDAPAWFSQALAIVPQRSTFDMNGLPIELLTWGEIGKPGLLFLHGYAAHADTWAFVAPFFADGYRCAAISLAGMGGSGHRADGLYDIADWGAEAIAAIGAAQLDASGAKPVVVAQSMAGFAGILAAIAHDPFAALIAIDTGIRTQTLPVADRVRLNQGHKGRLFPSIADALARYRLSPDQDCTNLYILDFLARHALREAEPEGGWRWRLDERMSTDLRLVWEPEMLRQVPCPIAYLYGERSGLVAHRIDEIRAALPIEAKVIGIPDSDHNVLADQPLALIAAVRATLAAWQASATI